MTEAERVWSGYIDAWNSHDIDRIVSAVAEQFIYDERPMTMTAPVRGRQAFRGYLTAVFKTLPICGFGQRRATLGRRSPSPNR